MGLAGLALLIAACARLERQQFSPAVVVLLAGGLIAWVAVFRREPPGDPLGPLDPPAAGPDLALLALSLAGAGVCAWKMPTQEFGLAGLVAWVVALASWVWAWWPPRAGHAASEPARAAGRLSPWAALGALAVILAIGIFFSFFRLSDVPANPVSDHAEEMLDMVTVLHGRYPIFFFGNLGVAPFHFYWTCAFIAGLKLPLHYLTLKIATSVIGVVAVLAMALAGAELGGAALGLSAAAFLAWGKWPFSLGRQGMEYTHAVLPAILAVWALLRYMRRGDRVSALAAGLAIGAGLYTYPAFRIVPLLVPLAVAFMILDRRRRGRRWALIGHGLLTAATAALVFLPLGKFALAGEFRSQFWSRSFTRLTEVEKQIPGERLRVFAGNIWNMLRAFHWKGSSTWTVIMEWEPFLDIVLGALFFAGLVLVAGLAWKRAWRWTFLLPAFFLLTLPSTLSLAYPGECPSLNRAGTAIPVVFLIAALPFAHLARSFWRQGGASRVAGSLLLAGVCGISIQQNYLSYFVKFSDSYEHVVPHTVEMAETLREYHARGVPYSNCYLLGYPFWGDGRNIAFEIDDPGWAQTHILLPGEVRTGLQERPLLFLYNPGDKERLDKLRQLYPGSGHIVHQSTRDRDFGVYLAP